MRAESPRNMLRDVFRDAAIEASGPIPVGEPEISRLGLGYMAEFEKAGVQLKVTHIKTRSGETTGELTCVRLTANGVGHLYQGRFNLSSLTARTTAAKYLKERCQADWVSLLEQFCLAVLRRERQGEPWLDLDTANFPVEMSKMVDPIVPLNLPTVLFAPFSTGKTTLAAAVALSVSLGVEIVPGWRSLQGPVVILDWEDQPKPWQDRLRMLARGAGQAGLGRIIYRTCYKPLTDDVESIASFCDQVGAVLIVVDSVGLALGISEGDPADGAMRLFAALRAIGRTSLLIDQVSAETARLDGPAAKSYGSIFKMYLARCAFELRREKEPRDGRAEVLMINTKVNHGPKLKPIGLVYEYGPDSIRIVPAEIEAHDLQQAMPHHQRVARLLSQQGPTLIGPVAEELGLTTPAVRSLVSRHKDLFKRLSDGRIAVIQSEGSDV
jgi:hypothetical protein